MNEINVQPGSFRADNKFRITVSEQGPVLVYGRPPLALQYIVTNDEGASWDFVEGESLSNGEQPMALCRCGHSANKPFCDGSHKTAQWDPRLKPAGDKLLDGARHFEGPTLTLTDNKRFCAFARFCDAKGRVWNLVRESDNYRERELTIREADMCPGGRLSAWDNETKQPFEPKYEPSLGLIQDPALGVSGGLWVRGGISISREDGSEYEVRNRVVLCRCGHSANKPFCDGSHASVKFRDGLSMVPPEK